ncbi:MAG: hypothetical protein KC422_04905 [Trueperaceae bacterium]|nr:hypothetical protein [Trueperaceae bacterium]
MKALTLFSFLIGSFALAQVSYYFTDDDLAQALTRAFHLPLEKTGASYSFVLSAEQQDSLEPFFNDRFSKHKSTLSWLQRPAINKTSLIFIELSASSPKDINMLELIFRIDLTPIQRPRKSGEWFRTQVPTEKLALYINALNQVDLVSTVEPSSFFQRGYDPSPR